MDRGYKNVDANEMNIFVLFKKICPINTKKEDSYSEKR